MMKFPLLFAPALFLVSCSIPNTPLWNERQTAGSIRMPMETIIKVVAKGSLVSLVRNPVSGTQKGLSMLRNRSELAAESIVTLNLVDPPFRDARSINDILDRLKLPAPVPGTVEYLIDGKAFFTDLENEIRNATKSVDTRVFIYDNDDYAVRFSDLLRWKSRNTRCRVLMDELGSIASWWTEPESPMPAGFSAPGSMPHYLRKASRIKVRESKNPWFVTDHTKIFLIDDRIGYLGGMNIGREYRYDWHDMMVRVEGPVVTALKNDFEHAWQRQGGLGDWGVPFLKKSPVRKSKRADEIDIRILKTGPAKREIETAMLAAIRMARKRVYLQNSYFTSDLLVDELIEARKRGVDVRMIFPEDNDSKLLDGSNRSVARTLLNAGARIYLYPKFTHVKAIVVDDWACLGSANFDGLSMRINDEVNIAFSDKKKVDELVKNLFEIDFQQSKRLTKMAASSWTDDFLEPLLNQF